MTNDERYIPVDLINDILSRLPIKSIAIFASVCKPWRNLILSQDPHFLSSICPCPLFLTLKVKYSSSRQQLSCFVHHIQLLDDFRIIPYNHLNTPIRLCNNLTKIKFFHKFDSCQLNVIGSCRGLVYFTMLYSCIVLNPLTREYINIISTHPPMTTGYIRVEYIGLGFNSKSNSHKLLACHNEQDDASCWSSVLTIYNIDGPINNVVEDSRSTLICYAPVKMAITLSNGVLYWASPFNHLTLHSFNFDTQKYTTLPLPPPCYGIPDCERIGVLNDRLCFTHTSFDNQEIEVWVLKQRCTHDYCWMKLHHVVNLSGWKYRWAMGIEIRPIKYLEDGKLLMLHRKKEFLIVDFVAKAVKFLRAHLHHCDDDLLIPPHYVPSLFPLRDIAGDNVKVFKAKPR